MREPLSSTAQARPREPALPFSPPGEGAPQGRMRVRAKPRAVEQPEGFAPYPHPNPRCASRAALAARALQGTRADGAQAVPSRPRRERG
ncbi:hypothetical protein FHR49_001478 [Xanthomonas campestris]